MTNSQRNSQSSIPVFYGFVSDRALVPVPISVTPIRIVPAAIVISRVGAISIVGPVPIISPAVRHAAAPRVGGKAPTATTPHPDDVQVRLRGAVRHDRCRASGNRHGAQSDSSQHSKACQALPSDMPHITIDGSSCRPEHFARCPSIHPQANGPDTPSEAAREFLESAPLADPAPTAARFPCDS